MKSINELDQSAYELAITRCVECFDEVYLYKCLKNKYTLGRMFIFEKTPEGHKYWQFVLENGRLPNVEERKILEIN